MTIELLQSVLENGIDNTHYFNGRILTADALRSDQKASRRQRQQLGRAIGAGIVHGLTVQHLPGTDPPTLRVKKGLALNDQGQALELPYTIDLALAHERDRVDASAGLFVTCQPLDTGEYVSGRNVYVLALAPASGYREKAPMYGLSSNGNGQADGCGFKFAVEGVQFRLVEVNLGDEDLIPNGAQADLQNLINAEPQDDAVESRLRNLLAHLCLGSTETSDFANNIFNQLELTATAPVYGLLPRMTDPDPAKADEYTLTPCDVPLAILYWTTAGVQFVDMWAVRRRLTQLAPTQAGMTFVSDRRQAEGEAAFLQFQAQVAELTRSEILQSQIGTIRADNYFHYFPAAGIVPIKENTVERGFDVSTFFGGIVTPKAVYIEGDRLYPLLLRSFTYPPINLGEIEFMRLYMVRRNRQTLAEKSEEVTRYLVFANGHMPYEGDALYDQARFDYSNFGKDRY